MTIFHLKWVAQFDCQSKMLTFIIFYINKYMNISIVLCATTCTLMFICLHVYPSLCIHKLRSLVMVFLFSFSSLFLCICVCCFSFIHFHSYFTRSLCPTFLCSSTHCLVCSCSLWRFYFINLTETEWPIGKFALFISKMCAQFVPATYKSNEIPFLFISIVKYILCAKIKSKS